MPPTVTIVDYGMGNLRSVAKAVEGAGGVPRVVETAGGIDRAEGLVVPGVGAFGACMRNLDRRALSGAVRRYAESDRPLFGVCLGMQILYEWSEEGGVEGLGVLAGKVLRLPDTVKVPHMGWNDVSWTRDHPMTAGIPTGTRFYFVHSYVAEAGGAAVVGEVEHGVRFAAAAARGSIFATQFHPEKSGAPGLMLYRRFVETVERSAA